MWDRAKPPVAGGFCRRCILFRFSYLCIALLCTTTACASAKDEPVGGVDVAGIRSYKNPGPSKRYTNEDAIIKPFDINNDKTIDMWKIYTREKALIDEETGKIRLLRKEVDTNFDGKVDIWLYYNVNENLTKEERDTRFENNVDNVLFYDNGRVVRSESFTIEANREDNDALGDASHRKPNIIKTFRNGVMTRIERDNNADGILDEWEIYDANGKLVQIGQDSNGDGKVDIWQRFSAMEQ